MCTYFRFRIYAHMWQAVNHALCKATICLWSTLSNSLSVWMYLFCLLCMYNMSMYICICVLSTVGTGALICCIIVLYLLYWIKKRKKRRKKDQTTNAGSKRKLAALIRQANSWHQMKETNSWNHRKIPNGCLPASIRWKNTTKKTHNQITTV